MTERLVGRFRPAVTAIERTIERDEPDLWQDALDETEERLVSYDHRREQGGNLCNEIVRLENKYRQNLSIFKETRSVEEVLGLLLFNGTCLEPTSCSFGAGFRSWWSTLSALSRSSMVL